MDDLSGLIEIWKFIAGSLLTILGWILGRKVGREESSAYKGSNGKLDANSWEVSREVVLLRIKQLEDIMSQRSEHPEFHPLSNYINARLGKIDLRIRKVARHCNYVEEDELL